ncbi:DUF6776 family protein [Agitococcus lubricus]|uniref:Uncharacterized protein n=1 Tax=Agitococcus lubricus TaxID=1077255 RepID=A0A2T5IWS7_9GAMM|nr:DUF6776 family protein [Agitococcus lubricus]PTQ88401.1 hypothetical protein C8N29_11246 [Agitococcus lubricus]
MWRSGRRQKIKSYIAAPITAHWVAWTLLVVLLLGLTGAGCYYWGYDAGLRSVGASATEVKDLRTRDQQQAADIKRLNMGLLTLQQDRDIAIETAKKLQEDTKNQLATVADLQEQIAVYQRLLGAKPSSQAVNVDSITVKHLSANRYQYRMLITQLSNNQTSVAGQVYVKVYASNKKQSVSATPVEIKLQYFQNVMGEFVLPVGFQPESIQLLIQTTGKKASKIQKTFKWEVAP